ncbi:complex I subunit 5 family protein [candidate division KSB1 bacterium]
MQQLYPLFVAIPLGIAFIILLFPKSGVRIVEVIVALSIIMLLGMAVGLVGHTPFSYYVGKWLPPLGITLVSDSISTLLLLIISIVGLLSLVFSFQYMKMYTSRIQFYALFMLMIAGMNGVVITGDMFNLFVFLEIATISSYALVGFGCERDELEASFKYMILGSVSSTIILLGVAMMYGTFGTLNMADLGSLISVNGKNRAVLFAEALFIMGFGLKGAMVPFHAWLPDAHPSAPAPISAMLSGVLIKACGVYAIIRVTYHVIGMTDLTSMVLMGLGVLSMVVGVLLAVGQWDFKRLLAYHSISQMGYVMVGISLATPLGVLGGIFHLMNHAFFKSLLFLCSGAIEFSTGTRNLKQMGGLFKRMPVTSASCSIASLSISGVPPFNGFWSKLIIIIALVQAGYYTIATITVCVSFLTLVSFVKVQRYSLFGALPEKLKKTREIPVVMGAALVILAMLCIGTGVLYPAFGDKVLEMAGNTIMDQEKYISLILQNGQ